MRTFINRAVFFIGWLLSPFTFWNDAFINIPISYLCASIFVRFVPGNFLLVTLVFYWLSNILGILMMYVSGKNVLKSRASAIRELAILITSMAIYSLVLVLLARLGVLKPI